MSLFSILTAPGLGPLTQMELQNLGLTRTGDPPLTFQGDLTALYRANLHLRTATRILCNVGMPFFARSFDELVQRVSHLPWERFLKPGKPFAMRVKSTASKLYHEEAVAERIAEHLHARLGAGRQRGSDADGAQQIHVQLIEDRCTIGIDSSGPALHRRGYRLETARAPLREDLAAGVLLASGFDGTTPLIDPFCGSGTIAIEAALIATHTAPGMLREDFALLDWPGFDAALWRRLRLEAAEAAHARRASGSIPPILGSDRDAGAVRIAHANADRAGVLDVVSFACQAVSAMTIPDAPVATDRPVDRVGHIATNPPYGQRLGKTKDLRDLYAQLGNTLRARCPGWHVAVLSGNPALLGHTGLHLDRSVTFGHGGLTVTLGRGVVTDARG